MDWLDFAGFGKVKKQQHVVDLTLDSFSTRNNFENEKYRRLIQYTNGT